MGGEQNESLRYESKIMTTYLGISILHNILTTSCNLRTKSPPFFFNYLIAYESV